VKIDYTAANHIRSQAQAAAFKGAEFQQAAATLHRQASNLRDDIEQEAHKQLAEGKLDPDMLVWHSAPSGEAAWGIVDYSQHPDEPMFGVTYYDGDISVGVCGAGYDTFEEALAFALTKPLVDGGFDLVVVEA
jgi:hypothetical protein